MIKKFFLAASILCFFSVAHAETPEENKAKQFIHKVANDVIKIAGDNNASTRKKAAAMKKVMLNNFNVKWMSRFVLGRSYKDMTDDQKKLYYNEYQNYLLYSYLPNLLKYSNETYKITSIEQSGKRSYKVNAQIFRTDGKAPIDISYQVKSSKNNPSSFKIVDIIAEGISTILSQRSEFKTITQESGVSGLIQLIENKNNKLDKIYS